MPNLTTIFSRSPFRFAKGLQMWVRFYETNSITVTGLEHIEMLKTMTQGRVIIVTPHERDYDVTIVSSVLLNKPNIQSIYPFAIKIADISAHRNPFQDMRVYLGLLIAGKDNFYPIDYKRENGQWKAKPFNEANFQPMIHDLLAKKADVLIAAYGPPPKNQPQAERKPGIGHIYLAQITYAPILPVKVAYSGNTKKPDATVIFKKPFFVTGTTAKEMHKIYEKSKIGHLTEKDIQRREVLKKLLRKKAKIILRAVL